MWADCNYRYRIAYSLIWAELDRYMRNNKTNYYVFWVDIQMVYCYWSMVNYLYNAEYF